MSLKQNEAIMEDRLANYKDWMAEKKTDLDIWLENKGLSLTDIFMGKGQMYVMHKGERIDLPKDLEEHEEDYQLE